MEVRPENLVRFCVRIERAGDVVEQQNTWLAYKGPEFNPQSKKSIYLVLVKLDTLGVKQKKRVFFFNEKVTWDLNPGCLYLVA